MAALTDPSKGIAPGDLTGAAFIRRLETLFLLVRRVLGGSMQADRKSTRKGTGITFADYAEDGDSAALLSALRIIARVKGISTMADQVGMTRQGLQKALSAKGNARLDNINGIMKAMGYQLMPHRLENATA